MEILCFFAGIAFVYTKSIYPLALLAISFFFNSKYQIVIWFLLALAWGYLHQIWVADSGEPNVRVLPKASLVGTVVSIPANRLTKTQFQFHVHHLNRYPVDLTVQLSCYQHCPSFKVGQVWLLSAKLKKPENLGNPGSFDYVSSLKARHINWTGYVKNGAVKLSEVGAEPQIFLGLREKLAQVMENSLTDKTSLGILQALTINVTSNLNKELWDLFRRTGTTHLMVISGSHIGLIAAFIFSLIKWLWSRLSHLCLYCPAIKIASVISWLTALFYALLAGFDPPSQRAIFACFFLLLRNFLSQNFTVWQVWRYSLLLVLLYEPHAVLLPGFYLSFIAVAILILINQRVQTGKIKKAIYTQLACLVGLMPLTVYWFSYGAVNGLVANFIAIPLVGFVIVPFGLINLFLLYYFDLKILVVPLKFTIDWLLYYLQWVDSFALFNLNFSYTDLLAPFAFILGLLILIFMPIRAILPAAYVLLYAAINPAYPRVAKGDVRIDIVDVGQGLAAVIQTAKHLLVYDTGMKFYQGGDMAQLALIPYLNTLGIKVLDKVVISHPDLDHRGGLPSLEEKYSIKELLVDNVAFYHRGKNCHRYPAWEWDGVSFRFLAISQKFRDKNNSSCVLKIENKVGKVLFTGDIEKLAENYLVAKYGQLLKADVLIVPHHGSKTSSTLAFIKAVAPTQAIISYAFDNRYHFPHAKTLTTLQHEGATIYNTSDCGMVSVKLNKKINFIQPLCYKAKLAKANPNRTHTN